MRMRFYNNPVLSSELKIRMRGWKTALGIISYLGVMVFIAFLYYITFIQSSLAWNRSVNANQQAGISIYTMLAVLQFILILLVTPAQTAGSISSEREKQTLDLLLCTQLSSFGIIIGKLLSSMSHMLLLIVSSLPLFSIIFLFGGVTPGDMIMLFSFYIITAIAVGSIGIFFSTIFKRTVTATVVTYLTMFALGLISIILSAYLMNIYYLHGGSASYVPFPLYINPAAGLANILQNQISGGSGGILGLGTGYQTSFWIYNSITMLVIAGLLVLISIIRINPVNRLFSWKKNS